MYYNYFHIGMCPRENNNCYSLMYQLMSRGALIAFHITHDHISYITAVCVNVATDS